MSDLSNIVEVTAYISGNANLNDINLRINAKEAHYWESEKCYVGTVNNEVVSFVVFKPTDRKLDMLEVLASSDTVPSGKKRVWDGVMVVAGTLTAVVAYR
jgi:hypothetical protein